MLIKSRGRIMAFNRTQAKLFVESIDLRGTPRSIIRQDAAADAGIVFDKAKDQAQVIGSGLFSFQQGVTAEVREAISDATLLAQLHANKQIKFEENPEKWFGSYTEVLQNVGWDMQDLGWNDYSADGTQAEVNEKIIDLLTVALSAAPTAILVMTAAMKALRDMNPNSPWITLWSREVQKADMARFQIGLVNMEDNGSNARINLVACILSAKSALTQVLFFKWKDAHAAFKAATRSASINPASAKELGPIVRDKIIAYQKDYLSSITDL
jgi:hypothetical protein